MTAMITCCLSKLKVLISCLSNLPIILVLLQLTGTMHDLLTHELSVSALGRFKSIFRQRVMHQDNKIHHANVY